MRKYRVIGVTINDNVIVMGQFWSKSSAIRAARDYSLEEEVLVEKYDREQLFKQFDVVHKTNDEVVFASAVIIVMDYHDDGADNSVDYQPGR